MEPPNKQPGQTIIAVIKARLAYFKKKLNEIEDAKIRREKGTALSSDNELINLETEMRDKICVYEEKILPLWRVHTQRPASEDDKMVLMGLFCLGKLLDVSSPAKMVYKNEQKEPSDKQDKFRATREVLRVHDGDTRTHSQALADLLSHFNEITNSKSHSHKEVKEVVDKVRNSKKFGAPAKFEVRTRKLKKGWYGGTLNQFLRNLPQGIDAETELPLSGFINRLTFRINEKKHSAYRLTEDGLSIIRGIMKKVEQLHRKGVSHGDLNSHNIILDRNNSVKLLRCKYVKGKNGMQSDWKSLSETIREILREYPEHAIPLDVKGLINLLENYCRENHDIVFHHSSLWTPMEGIVNRVVIRSEMGASPDTEEVWSNANCVEEEKEDWTADICKHNVYRRGLDTWIEKLKKRPKRRNPPKSKEYKELVYVRKEDRSCIGGSEILSFSRMCFNHIHLSQQQNLGNEDKEKNKPKKKKKNSRQNEHRSLLQTEKELYVIFPNYMANFLERNRTQKLITSIYKTEC